MSEASGQISELSGQKSEQTGRPAEVRPPMEGRVECHVIRDILSGPPSEAPGKCHVLRDITGKAWVVAGVVAGCALAEVFFLRHLAQLPARGSAGVRLDAEGSHPAELPPFLGSDWIGQRAEVSAVEREILPADTGYSRRNYAFIPDRRKDVFLSVVLSGRDRSSIHRPELCLVGQGWTIEGATPHAFQFPRRPDAGFSATLLRVRREVQLPAAGGKSRGKEIVPQLVAYWFVGGDRVVATHWQRMALDAWNRVRSGRADRWAYVLLQTDARDGEAAALARLQGVLDATLPTFQRPLSSP